jgi:hypothetical protein
VAALLLETDRCFALKRVSLASSGGHDEKWLQARLFEHPELIPVQRIDPGSKTVIPICRELPLPRLGSTVFLDMLGVTPTGRLVLVECKLWRNPQARREVVAQILEYASLLRQWSYADLSAKVGPQLGCPGRNPLFEHASAVVPQLDEVSFVDAVSHSLAAGDFILVIAGDGIRSDLQAIADHLNGRPGTAARLALLEIQLWADEAGRTLLVPSLALRTEVIEHRILVDRQGLPIPVVAASDAEAVALTEELVETAADPVRSTQRREARAFWDRFIEKVHFDHADQPRPRHGGTNWVRLDLPQPAQWMTLYRAGSSEAGAFVSFRGEEGRAAYDALEAEADVLRKETGLAIDFERLGADPFTGRLSVQRRDLAEVGLSEDSLRQWLASIANALVNALRPRLARQGGVAGRRPRADRFGWNEEEAAVVFSLQPGR